MLYTKDNIVGITFALGSSEYLILEVINSETLMLKSDNNNEFDYSLKAILGMMNDGRAIIKTASYELY